MTEEDGVCAYDEAKDGEAGGDESLEGEGLAAETGEEVVRHEAGGGSEGGVD